MSAYTEQYAPPGRPSSGQARFPSRPEAPAAACRFVRSLLDPVVPAERADDLELITSELVTNAYRYGTGPGDSVLVSVEATAEPVRLEVHDPVRRHPHHKPASDEHGRGRGLTIAKALATRWGVDNRPFGKAVWVEVEA